MNLIERAVAVSEGIPADEQVLPRRKREEPATADSRDAGQQETRPAVRVQRRMVRRPEAAPAPKKTAPAPKPAAPVIEDDADTMPEVTVTPAPAARAPQPAKRKPPVTTKKTVAAQQVPQRAPQPIEASPHSTVFDLNLDWLAEQGFYTPDTEDKRLALELRAIKRRLLRRLQFYRLDSEKRRRQNGRDRQRNTILFTSTRPAEGKTFTALNLALSLAIEDNINVLLIDADVPRPKVFQHLGLEADYGLTDRILEPDLPVSELILRERNTPFSVLSQGMAKASPIDIFARDEMSRFIDELSLRYPDRIIIFDAPPVLATPEAVVLARHVDEVVFVVEANETPEPAVATALDEILDNNSRVSLVLNKCLAPEASNHYGSYEEYYNTPGSTRSSGKRRSGRR